MPTNIRASTSTNGGVFDPASGDGILDIYTGATSGAQVKAVSLAASGAVSLAGQTTGTTVGAAGGASALPATPLGYLTINLNGTNVKIPYYN